MYCKSLGSALALFLISHAVQAVPTVSFEPGAESVLVGDSFILNLVGTSFNLTADGNTIDNLTGGQKFNLEFDPGLLEVLSITIDSRWNFTTGNKTGTVDNVGGSVTGMAFGTFPATTDDSFNIASITFRALSAGQTLVIASGGEFAGKVNNVTGAKVLPSFENASVQITSAVPEPEQWAMLMVGLGLMGLRLRKHRTAE